ncbi:hypothetical protein [Muricoccus roseus]|uniref:hypothetical protein n=1 Tax=Muricoccus roseus TaxID=198092 RepID=UPI0009347989|nr:hypothetical protein [Roseomonas rosea]
MRVGALGFLLSGCWMPLSDARADPWKDESGHGRRWANPGWDGDSPAFREIRRGRGRGHGRGHRRHEARRWQEGGRVPLPDYVLRYGPGYGALRPSPPARPALRQQARRPEPPVQGEMHRDDLPRSATDRPWPERGAEPDRPAETARGVATGNPPRPAADRPWEDARQAPSRPAPPSLDTPARPAPTPWR